MTISTGGAVVIILGILIIAGAILLLVFAGPFEWWQISLLIGLGCLGAVTIGGGTEMKR